MLKKHYKYFLVCLLMLTGCAVCFGAENIIPQDGLNSVKVVLFPLKKAVISSIVDGIVEKYNFREGEVIKKGDVLALLDDDLYKNSYDVAKSEYEKAVATYEFAKNTFKQDEDLYLKGGLSVQEYEKVKLDKATAYANMQEAQSALKIAKLKLDACTIKAPFDGRLTEQLTGEHEFVRAGQPILEAINDSKLLAVMYLPSSEISTLKEGMPMHFYIDETKTEHEGKVYEVSGYVYSGSRTFEVKAIIDNKNRSLYSGMSGYLIQNDKGSNVGK